MAKKEASKSTTRESNLSIMKLLVSTDEFQQKVDVAREVLGIPVDGLETEAEAEKWTLELIKEADRVILESRNNESSYQGNDIPLNYLTNWIDEVMFQFNLPLNFKDSIRHYLLLDKISAPSLNFSVNYPFLRRVGKKPESVTVNIYYQLTDRDLVELKNFVNKYCLLEKKPKLRNIDRNLLYEETREDLERFDEVENKEYKMTINEAARELEGHPDVKKTYDSKRALDKARQKIFGLGK